VIERPYKAPIHRVILDDTASCIPKIIEFSLLAVDRVHYETAIELHMWESSWVADDGGGRFATEGMNKPENLLQTIKDRAMPVSKIYTTHINPLLNDEKWQEYEKDSPQSSPLVLSWHLAVLLTCRCSSSQALPLSSTRLCR
jgi:hypothetical protein